MIRISEIDKLVQRFQGLNHIKPLCECLEGHVWTAGGRLDFVIAAMVPTLQFHGIAELVSVYPCMKGVSKSTRFRDGCDPK